MLMGYGSVTPLNFARQIAVAAVATILVSSAALAEPAEPAEPEEAELSSEELAELEQVLAADQKEQKESGSPPEAAAEPSVVARAIQSLNPDISVLLDVTAAAFSESDNLQGGGHDPTDNGFNLQQIELAIGAAVDPYFRLDGNIVFGLEGVEVEEMYATTLGLPWNLQARTGQFLTRLGRVNPTHLHSWAFVDQPFFLTRYFGGEGNRGLGFELSYLMPTPWYAEIVGSVTGAGGETARNFLGEDGGGVESWQDFQYLVALKQFFELSPDWSFLVGLTATTGPNSTGPDNRTHLYGADVYLKYRPITRQSWSIIGLQSEWIHRRREIAGDRLTDWSGYVHLFNRFAQRWTTAARFEYGSPAENGDGQVGFDDLDPEWTKGRQRFALNLSFLPSENSRLRLQGSIDIPTWLDESIYAVFLAAEFSIGAHGAHKF